LLSLAGCALLALVVSTCTPAPKYVACDDDAACTSIDPNFAYCLQRRCVECIGNAGCGRDNRCIDGVCHRKCRDRRDCRDGEVCSDGECSID
jgi:hypothetical protein